MAGRRGDEMHLAETFPSHGLDGLKIVPLQAALPVLGSLVCLLLSFRPPSEPSVVIQMPLRVQPSSGWEPLSKMGTVVLIHSTLFKFPTWVSELWVWPRIWTDLCCTPNSPSPFPFCQDLFLNRCKVNKPCFNIPLHSNVPSPDSSSRVT